MLELLALVGLFVVGILFLKIFFGVLGLAFHILLFPLKLVLGLVAVVIALPFMILFLPVFLVLGVGVAVLGGVLCTLFCWAFVI